MAQITLNSSGVASNGTLALQSNGTTTAVTIDASQNVGIGISPNASSKLQVKAATNSNFAVWDSSGTPMLLGLTDAGASQSLRIAGSPLTFTGNGGGGAEAMRIDSSGNVGVGTSSPSVKLEVAGTQRITNATQTNSAILQVISDATGSNGVTLESTYYGAGGFGPMKFTTGGSERARIDTSGNLLVGKTATTIGTVGTVISSSRVQVSNAATTSADDGIQIYSTGASAYRFFVGMGGQINATNTSITAISDVSLKENIRDLETGLSEVLQLKPRRFDWKEETQLEQKNIAGFIAQELEEVLPDLVYEYKYSDTETKKSIKMGDILPTLVKAIQEQQAIITQLQADVAALKGTA